MFEIVVLWVYNSIHPFWFQLVIPSGIRTQTGSFKLSLARWRLLISLKDHTFDLTDYQVSKCGTKICKTCNILITDNYICINFTKGSFSTHNFENLSCRSYSLVYAIECNLCGLTYVGEKKGHRFQINHGGKQLLCKYFNLPDHSILSIGRDGQLHTSIYDKRDDFNFHITNFPFLSSNIPSSPPYGVFISQIIRYTRACSSYECFILRARRLSSKLLKQG